MAYIYEPSATMHSAGPLSVDGYPQARQPVVGLAEDAQDARRREYWTEGDGVRVFLEEVARRLNASPHMAHRPFEISMTDYMTDRIRAIVQRGRDFSGDWVLAGVMNFADETATILLGNLVRRQQWLENWVPNKMPIPMRYPTYCGGQSSRGSALANAFMPRISDELQRREYTTWLLENNLK
jgi:hypothetical protein